MLYRSLADFVVVFHFAFVTFVMVGGLIVLRWRRVMWFHLPAVAWGIYIELSHGLCPLTPLENQLREWGGATGYEGGFVDHYIMPVLYPAGLTAQIQVLLACLIIAINATCYGIIGYRCYKTRHADREEPVATDGNVTDAATLPPAGGTVPRRSASRLEGDAAAPRVSA